MRKIMLLIIALGFLTGCFNEISFLELNNKITATKFVFNELDHKIIETQILTHFVESQLNNALSKLNYAELMMKIYNNHKKPFYEQLKSHTVYIKGIISELDYNIEEWIGTGFIINISDKYTWIITNAHVASKLGYRATQEVELYVGDTEKESVKAHGLATPGQILQDFLKNWIN